MQFTQKISAKSSSERFTRYSERKTEIISYFPVSNFFSFMPYEITIVYLYA